MKRKVRYLVQFLSLLSVLMICCPDKGLSQCPMCKAAVTSNSNDGKGGDGKGSALASNLNLGILYLFVLPYGSIALVTIVVYRSYRKRQRALAQESLAASEKMSELNANPSTDFS